MPFFYFYFFSWSLLTKCLLSSLLKLCFCVMMQVTAPFLHLCHSFSLPLSAFPPLSTTSELRALYQLTAGGKRVMPSAKGLNENMCKSLPQTHRKREKKRKGEAKAQSVHPDVAYWEHWEHYSESTTIWKTIFLSLLILCDCLHYDSRPPPKCSLSQVSVPVSPMSPVNKGT